MTEQDPPAFDPEQLEPLRFDVSRGAPPAMRARVLARLQHTITGLDASSLDEERSSPEGARLEAPRLSGPAMRALAAKPIWVATTAFLLGGATGAGIYASVRPPVERVVYVDRPVSSPEPGTFVAPSLPVPKGDSPVAGDRNAVAPSPPAARAAALRPAASGLAAERALLDQARQALASGNDADAARVLDLHARRFPSGLLVEEREALTIKTMVENGRIEEARKLGLKFRERFPKSLFGPAVDEALGTNP